LIAVLLLVFVPNANGDPPQFFSEEPVAASVVSTTTTNDFVIRSLRQQVRREHRRYIAARRHVLRLKQRWQPTVSYAIRLASAVSGVPQSELYAVARCESGLSPAATNGRYKGVFQLGWAPFGFSPFDPVANALSAALTVRHDGGWRQWQCKP